MHNQTGRLYVLLDLSRIHNLGHKNGLIRVHFREFCFGFTFWDTKTAENVTLFVNRAAARKKEDLLPEGNRPPKRYGTGKRLSITLLRKAVHFVLDLICKYFVIVDRIQLTDKLVQSLE